jgi:CxxC motif-containing protein (DUF1111 family)
LIEQMVEPEGAARRERNGRRGGEVTMRAKGMRLVVFVLSEVLAVAGPGAARGADPEWAGAPDDPAVALGRRLFLRQWEPDDPRGRGGDGLGPVFNERSCVACHGLGGPGGAGPNARNVELLTAVALNVTKGKPVDRSSLSTVHPGLAETGSIVLHRFGLSPTYQAWRQNAAAFGSEPAPRPPVIMASIGSGADQQAGPPPPRFRMVVSKRSAPALFGAGRIDAIPDTAIEAEARRQAGGSSGVKGRVSRLKDGRIGRFGWKAQVPGLGEFVLTACANELGLEVPGHHQAGDPLGYGARSPARPDMSGDECGALIAYVRGLPAPVERPLDLSAAGRVVFDRIGCTECHRPSLGGVSGVYSDLLLHDLGPSLSDDGMYYGSEDESSPGTPKRQEWRTPPLWGIVGTGPYLHDGRARSVTEAIEAHGGEAQSSANAFGKLSKTNKAQLLSFLRSLKIPPASKLGPVQLTRRERLLESAEASAAASR